MNKTMTVLCGVLISLSLVVAAGGVATLSEATQGVGALALGCFLAILARICQAAGHHASRS